MGGRKFRDPSSPFSRLQLWMQQHRHGAFLARQVCNRAQPPMDGQSDPGKSDWHTEGESQDHADRCALTQNNQSFGNRVSDQGGHIPS